MSANEAFNPTAFLDDDSNFPEGWAEKAAIALYQSQENYLARLGNKPYMFCGTGAGKTRMAMVRAKRAGFNKVLVITPATVRDTKQWEKEREKIGIEFDEFQVEGFSFLQKYKKLDFTKYSDYYVIIDEAHKIKNSQSLQGMGAYILCRLSGGYSFLSGGYSFLSATPMSKWADAVNYAKITASQT